MLNTNTNFSGYDSTITARNKYNNMGQSEKKSILESQGFSKETIRTILT